MENEPVRGSVIFCVADGALALLEVLHFISLRRLCSRPNARSFSPRGLVGRCVGCAGTFGFIFVAPRPPFPVIFGLGASAWLPSSLYLDARRSTREKTKQKRKTASRKSKACIVALLEPISVDSRARGRDILFAYAERRNEKEKVRHRSWFLAVNGAGRHVG